MGARREDSTPDTAQLEAVETVAQGTRRDSGITGPKGAIGRPISLDELGDAVEVSAHRRMVAGALFYSASLGFLFWCTIPIVITKVEAAKIFVALLEGSSGYYVVILALTMGLSAWAWVQYRTAKFIWNKLNEKLRWSNDQETGFTTQSPIWQQYEKYKDGVPWPLQK